MGLEILKLPQTHSTMVFPMCGIAENRLVITVAAQNDICPQGRTYPVKAVIIIIRYMVIPIVQVVWFFHVLW